MSSDNKRPSMESTKFNFKKLFDEAPKNEKGGLISLINPDGLGGFNVYFHEKPDLIFQPTCLQN